jgi:hypothetical protein
MADIPTDPVERSAGGRRSLLLGAATAAAAWLAQGAGSTAIAATGDTMKVGRRNVASSRTSIVNETASETALRARASGSGAIALEGVSERGTGVHGSTRSGNGVEGDSVFGTGISGRSIEPGSYAVSGDSASGTGVQGGSHDGTGVQGNSQSGVAVSGGNVSETEPAIRGWAQNGQAGVMGRSTAFDEFSEIASPKHVGVFGVSDRPGGRGVLARSHAGRALQADGRVRFSTSGIGEIAAGAGQATVDPGCRVVASAKVLAVLQGDPGNGATVAFIVADPDTDTFTVHASGSVLRKTSFAWFLMD